MSKQISTKTTIRNLTAQGAALDGHPEDGHAREGGDHPR